MIDMYFNSNGKFFANAADENINEEDIGVNYFLAEAPDVPRWRLTLDIESGVVTDCYAGMTKKKAEEQLDKDLAAQAAQSVPDDPA